ncbi:Uncharacterised protein [Ralstonia pickettii]|jgi:hypothetical protein|nr:hypothetical protein HMPREF1004_00496 [Ralstonia pickettii]EGY64793.1 hypothetical protein HMPREF0989_00443 [Ralstonia sp. 5_2_56FAA]MBU6524967.1 hypothetical protein [Ralstonia sp. B265]NPT52952.1 hypothetical protein [Ralstonia sp. 3N]SCW98565.1 hypothetical protein SAMN02799637_04838 [Ralstonia sp. UNCCL144]
MPEHMNVAIVLERATSPADRLTTISALAAAFARFFGEPQEVFRINYVTGASECEAWSTAPRLLEEQPGEHELLFVYGNRVAPLDGARSSIHTESNGMRASFVVSLPVPLNLPLAQLEPHLLHAAEAISRAADTFAIAAGWELELDVDLQPQDIVRGSFTDFPLCRWLAGPTPLFSGAPIGFAGVGRSDGITLLRRI